MKHVIKTRSVPGVICGNRDFFPGQLITEARADIARLFATLRNSPLRSVAITEKK